MTKMDPIEKSQYIANRYKTYLRSSFRFGNDKLQTLFESELEQEDLFKGPYVDLNLPFQRGKSIRDLVDEGVICQSFLKLKDINFTRPLYAHQEEAIRKIGQGKSIVVTTGTGSGKTECFLYPILNSILQDIENGNQEIGIRAIFLYPMNALVNDQFDRIRKILSECSDITFGFFTGDTPETVPVNYRQKQLLENKIEIPENELVSREEIRKNPPYLLFTNYSMLEYMLIRPTDYSLFRPEQLRNWKYVVMDEAHTYHGSLGIEVSMLMRRLTALVDTKPRFILTSATIGTQGESEDAIIEFAQNLTSVKFDASDIIFSERIPLAQNSDFSVKGEDYLKLKEHENDLEVVKTVCQKYGTFVGENVPEYLFEILSHDYHVHMLYNILEKEAKNFSDFSQEFVDLEDAELIAMIDLINYAEKNGIGLYELKYHSFVRPLSGAYITLNEDPILSLTKTNAIGELKAFEVGNCHYCNTSFIIGKIQHNKVNKLDYLFQNDEIDIYENYGDYEQANIDYFLTQSTVEEQGIDDEKIEEYVLCSKCGCIYPKENLNAPKCKCGEKYQRIIYRVRQSKKDNNENATNNLYRCPCCNHESKSGIVRTLDLGKDEGTAIIAQTLYEAIDEGVDTVKKAQKLSLKPKEKNKNEDTDSPKVKQFLTFSDSRQQASFAALFLNTNYDHMLRKRIIWEFVEEQSYQDIKVDQLAAQLSSLIKKKNLFSEDRNKHNISCDKEAWASILIDLLKVDGAYDGEGLGLYYFDLDLSEIMDQISEQEVQEEYGKYNITKNDLETVMQVVLGVFKTIPAIDSTKSSLTFDEKKEFLEYRRFDNYVMYSDTTGKNVHSFLPLRNQSNMVVRYVQKVCKCTIKEATEILSVIFNNLAVESELLKKQEAREAYQIDAGRYIVKNYKTNQYYRCKKCGRLTPYNVHNVCTQDHCNGELIAVNPDEVLKDNYYRNQYKTMKIEDIVIKEHTAQLKRETAKQYQQEFKDQKINILSCSTTFEMGVDLGALETVFMRNVPPTPANYVQRAGRAGRRKDSSAYILTYCGTGSHDYTYFCSPEKMISGVINPPSFDILNRKIIERHLMASSLGFFFRKEPEFCTTIDGMVFGSGLNAFKKYMSSHPEDLLEYIDKRVIPEEVYSEYHDFHWYDEMGEDEKLNYLVDSYKEMADEFDSAKEKAREDEDYSEANYYKNQLEHLHKDKMLPALSKYCVIPKYGFPVDTVDLKIYDNGVCKDDYDLNRDLRIAISEYAPDSEVIVDERKYTSKYITLPKASSFPKHYLCKCEQCQRMNVFYSAGDLKECQYCGAPLHVDKNDFYIEPIYGFKTGDTKESTRMKPKRSYSGEVSYLGGGIRDEKHVEIGSCISLESSTNSELLVVNRSGFFMCPVCGYSEIATHDAFLTQKSVKHNNYRQYPCPNEELQKIHLGHSFQTDVVELTIPALRTDSDTSYAQALSFMYAILEGTSQALEIERDDIDGLLLMNVKQGSYDVLLYDDVPGGAGQVKRLMDQDSLINVLKAALDKVSQNCCDENTSCYNCLRNYHNQAYHGLLRRKYAKDLLNTLLNEIYQTTDRYEF